MDVVSTWNPAPGGGPVPQRSLTIDLWCNAVAGGWAPSDLESGLGGGEEALVLWAATLAGKGHRVRIYHNSPCPGESCEYGGAFFLPHASFDPFEDRDVMVSWKASHPWRLGVQAAVRIHWSSDIEPPWPPYLLERLDAFVAMSPYHRGAMPWLPEDKAVVVPLGVDLDHLERHRAERISGKAIYASSPDRGLETLLRDWPRLLAAHPGLMLDVCYGWKNFMACSTGNPAGPAFREEMERLLRQEGITYRGALSRDEMARAYWEAEYWMLPLNRAESELFCLNAAKAMHCGAIGVVNRIGALQDTVTRWIDHQDFRDGASAIQQQGSFSALSWREVVERYWLPLIESAPCIL